MKKYNVRRNFELSLSMFKTLPRFQYRKLVVGKSTTRTLKVFLGEQVALDIMLLVRNRQDARE